METITVKIPNEVVNCIGDYLGKFMYERDLKSLDRYVFFPDERFSGQPFMSIFVPDHKGILTLGVGEETLNEISTLDSLDYSGINFNTVFGLELISTLIKYVEKVEQEKYDNWTYSIFFRSEKDKLVVNVPIGEEDYLNKQMLRKYIFEREEV